MPLLAYVPRAAGGCGGGIRCGLQRPVDDRLGGVDERALRAAGVVSEQLERSLFVDRMALHQDPLCTLDDGWALERSLEVAQFGKAPEDDLDRVLPPLRVVVGDVGENAAPCSLDQKRRIRCLQERHHRAGRLVDDLLDHLQGMF